MGDNSPDLTIDLNRSISVSNNADRNLGVTVSASELDWNEYANCIATTYNKDYVLNVLEEGLRTHTIDFRDIILLCNKIKS